MKEAIEQMMSYNNAAFKMPNHLNRPLHPHAFFLASPLTNYWTNAHLNDSHNYWPSSLGLLPGGLGLLQMKNVNTDSAKEALERLRTSTPPDNPAKINLDLRLTSGEQIWSNYLGYHVNVDDLLSPQVGSQKVMHEAVGMKLEGDEYRKNASLSSQNRCEIVFK